MHWLRYELKLNVEPTYDGIHVTHRYISEHSTGAACGRCYLALKLLYALSYGPWRGLNNLVELREVSAELYANSKEELWVLWYFL